MHLLKTLEDKLDTGASVAITVDGENVVDLWAGDLVDAGDEKWSEGHHRQCLVNNKDDGSHSYVDAG